MSAVFGGLRPPLQPILDTTRACVCIAARTTLHRSEEHTSELQSQSNLVCRLLLEKKKQTNPALNQLMHKLNPHAGLVCAPQSQTLYTDGGLAPAVYAYTHNVHRFSLTSQLALLPS